MKILRAASLGSNFTGSYYNKKEWQLASQRPSQQLLIKLAIVKKPLKNYNHYCLLLLPNFFFIFNNMLSYLSFLKQLQFLVCFSSLLNIFFGALTSQLAASFTHSIYSCGSLGFSFWFSMGFPRIFYLIIPFRTKLGSFKK